MQFKDWIKYKECAGGPYDGTPTPKEDWFWMGAPTTRMPTPKENPIGIKKKKKKK
jgi:hypothetical protein